MFSRWQMCRAAAEGEHAVHLAGETYLPRLFNETDKDYALRLKMTPFFNAFWRTVSGLRGMLFRKPPQITAPESIKTLLNDIDLAGTPIDRLVNTVAEDALIVGSVGLLVDYPSSPGALTMADAKALKLRPTINRYKAESIINVKETRTANGKHVSMIVLAEEFEFDGDDEFSVKEETRYRVLDLKDGKYRQRLFRKDDKGNDEQVGDDVYPMMNNQPLSEIPFIFIGTDNLECEIYAPPLIDLATTCLHHYRQSSSYERGCHMSGMATMFISGYQPDENNNIYLGGNMANILPQSDARAYFVEVTSQFGALRTNLEDKKGDMAVLGARMLESQKAGVESAEALARRQNGDESLLSDMAQNISAGITKALTIFAKWHGVEGDIEYQLNRDFLPAGLTSQDLAGLVSAWQAGAISQATLFSNLQAGEVIAPDVTFDEEQERIKAQAPMLA